MAPGGGRATVRLGGVLDGPGVRQVQAQVLRAVTTRGGLAVSVVLDDVEVLAAPGVRLVESVTATARHEGVVLDLRASPGTPARLVLDALGLRVPASPGQRAHDPVRVALIDPSSDTRELVRFLLDRQPDFEVVTESLDGPSALREVLRRRPDLALVDTLLEDAPHLVREIREQSPRTVVVAACSFLLSHETAGRLEDEGAHGHVRTDGGLRLVLAELRTILHAHDVV